MPTVRLALALTVLLAAACGPRSDVTYNPAPEPEGTDGEETSGGDVVEEGIDGDACPEDLKEGDPCGPRDGWCVLDWGQPCGYSQALWCREGKWELEQEANLCDEDRAGI